MLPHPTRPPYFGDEDDPLRPETVQEQQDDVGGDGISPIEEAVEPPAQNHVRLHRGADPSTFLSGVSYQKCGGGRRIIRKSKGGN